jgi:hypothetical protein
MYSNVYNNFLKIKLLLVFHETLSYLIDSLNLNDNEPGNNLSRGVFMTNMFIQQNSMTTPHTLPTTTNTTELLEQLNNSSF